MSEQSTQNTQSTQSTQIDPNTILLGPLPYNRFLGNPPAGMTAEEAFKAEMGYDWLVQVNMQPVLAKINQLEVQNKDLQTQVDKLKVELTASQQAQVKQSQQAQQSQHQSQQHQPAKH